MPVSATTIGEEFLSNSEFTRGLIVGLNQKEPDKIELTSLINDQYMIGVVNDSGDNLVTYAKEGSTLAVSLSGEVDVFVSDVNGTVFKGDFVGASWLEGVGMKAETGGGKRLLGVALEEFNISESVNYGSITTPEGEKESNIGTIRIRLLDEQPPGEKDINKGGIESLLSKISGKDVSSTKVIIASFVFMISILTAGFFISSSVHGSFISLGRNPRASGAIYKSLLHVTLLALLVVAVGAASSYVVLVV